MEDNVNLKEEGAEMLTDGDQGVQGGVGDERGDGGKVDGKGLEGGAKR